MWTITNVCNDLTTSSTLAGTLPVDFLHLPGKGSVDFIIATLLKGRYLSRGSHTSSFGGSPKLLMHDQTLFMPALCLPKFFACEVRGYLSTMIASPCEDYHNSLEYEALDT